MLDMTVEQRDAIKTALLETYFRPSWQPGVPLSQAFEVDLNAHIETRWRHFSNLIPWLAGHVELSTSRVIEIGSGTGSSTAAIAPHVDFVQCYEINPVSIEAARRRLAILGVKNAEIVQSAFDEASAAKIGTVDGILLAAVLEHCTIQERLSLLTIGWRSLKPGGWMCVVDTPNRGLSR